MFTTSGIGVISKEEKVEERQSSFSSYFNLSLITKDPYKSKRHYIKLSIQVPHTHTEEAREALQPGRGIQVRIGELTGRKLESGFVVMNVATRWAWVEVIKAIPIAGNKEE